MLTIKPTTRMFFGNHKPRNYLAIGIELPDGRRPVEHFRGASVGVGGVHSFCPLGIAKGEPVRAATLNEMRRKARHNIAQMLERFPEGRIYVRRSQQ